jgi:hypothetical protein
MALTEEQAISAARAFVEANPIPDRAYRYTVKKWHPVAEGWCFIFTYERADGRLLSDDDDLGGAPGYIVASHNGQVRTIGWAEWGQRQLGAG